jgi:hypothetical protein
MLLFYKLSSNSAFKNVSSNIFTIYYVEGTLLSNSRKSVEIVIVDNCQRFSYKKFLDDSQT